MSKEKSLAEQLEDFEKNDLPEIKRIVKEEEARSEGFKNMVVTKPLEQS